MNSKSNCIKCKKPAELKCSRCGAGYCERACQIADWTKHKPNCKRPEELIEAAKLRNIRFADLVHKKISGNIAIYYAHYLANVIIEINETIEEFVAQNSDGTSMGHFAHITQGDGSTPKATYKFSNYTYTAEIMHIPSLVHRVKPPAIWSVWFELI